MVDICGNRQRRYFYYLTGCELPDCYAMYNIAADWLTLFIPPVDAEQVMWAGMPLTEGKAIEKYTHLICYWYRFFFGVATR